MLISSANAMNAQVGAVQGNIEHCEMLFSDDRDFFEAEINTSWNKILVFVYFKHWAVVIGLEMVGNGEAVNRMIGEADFSKQILFLCDVAEDEMGAVLYFLFLC